MGNLLGSSHFGGSVMRMLPGPDLFFQRAKCIMPWHDEPDSPRALSVSSAPTSHVGDKLVSITSERSPHDALPLNWQVMPKAAGVTICVQRPSLSAGQILHHCKDWFWGWWIFGTETLFTTMILIIVWDYVSNMYGGDFLHHKKILYFV